MTTSSIPPRHWIVLAVVGVLAPTSLLAQSPPDSAAYAVAGTDSASVARFIVKVQRAAATNDSAAIAELINYRQNFGFWDGRTSRCCDTRAQFLRAYHRVFDDALKKEIAAVTPDSLFANYQGVMFNSGRVWAYPDSSGKLLIMSINEPVQRWRARQTRSKRPTR